MSAQCFRLLSIQLVVGILKQFIMVSVLGVSMLLKKFLSVIYAVYSTRTGSLERRTNERGRIKLASVVTPSCSCFWL